MPNEYYYQGEEFGNRPLNPPKSRLDRYINGPVTEGEIALPEIDRALQLFLPKENRYISVNAGDLGSVFASIPFANKLVLAQPSIASTLEAASRTVRIHPSQIQIDVTGVYAGRVLQAKYVDGVLNSFGVSIGDEPFTNCRPGDWNVYQPWMEILLAVRDEEIKHSIGLVTPGMIAQTDKHRRSVVFTEDQNRWAPRQGRHIVGNQFPLTVENNGQTSTLTLFDWKAEIPTTLR